MNYEENIFYLAKKFLNKETVVLDLIDKYDNEDFCKQLNLLADSYIKKYIYNSLLTLEEKAVILVSLIFLNLLHYDGNTWKYAYEAYPASYGCGSRNYVENTIRSIISVFKKYAKYNNKESYVAIPLIYAGVTHFWLDSFFDFCFEIYKQNLSCVREIEDEDLDEKMINVFTSVSKNNYLNDEEDEISINDKSYKLSKYTQSAISNGANSIGVALIGSRCVRMIIDCINGLDFEPDAFYKDAFYKWKESFFDDETKRSFLNSSGSWHDLLSYDNGSIYLTTRNLNIDENYGYENLSFNILYNGEVKQNVLPKKVTKVIGEYKIESQKIKLDFDVLNKLSYQLVSNGTVLYDSGSKLHNDVLFFRESDGEMIRPDKDFNGRAYVISKQPMNNVPIYDKTDFFNITEMEINSFDSYSVDGNSYTFFSIKKFGINGNRIKNCKIKSLVLKENIDVYTSTSFLLFETDRDISNFYLAVDNKRKYNVPIEKINATDSVLKKCKVDLSYLENGYHAISVLDENGNSVSNTSFSFYLDNKFNIKISKVKENKYQLELYSSLTIDTKDFTLDDDFVVFDCFLTGCGSCKLKVKPNLFTWSFDGEEWFDCAKRISYKELGFITNNSIFIKCYETPDINFSYLMIDSTNGTIIPGKKTKGRIYTTENVGIYRLDVNSILLMSDQAGYLGCRINMKSNSYKSERLTIEFVPNINESNFNIVYDANTQNPIIDFNFDFDEEINFRIETFYNGIHVFSKPIHKGPLTLKDLNLDMRPLIKYKLIFSIKDDFFDLERIINVQVFSFFDRRGLKGCRFEILNAEVSHYNPATKDFVSILKPLKTPHPYVSFGTIKPDGENFEGYIERWIGRFDQFHNKNRCYVSTEGERKRDDELWIYIKDKDEELYLYDDKDKKIYEGMSDSEYASTLDPIDRILVRLEGKRV